MVYRLPPQALGGNGVLLLNHGATVSPSTPVGTVIFEKAPPITTWDFKSMTGLPAEWTRRGVAGESFGPSGMTVTYAAGQGHQVAVPSSPQGTMIVQLASGPIDAMIGPIMHNGASAGVGASWYQNPLGYLGLGATSDWVYQAGVYVNVGGTPSFPTKLRLRFSGGQVLMSYMDPAGAGGWSNEGHLAFAGPVTLLSIGSLFGSGTVTVESVSWQAQSGSGGLRGWWDGSGIVPFS